MTQQSSRVGFDGTRSKVPTATKGKTYTKNEMMDLVDYYADVWQIPRRLAHALTGQESGYQQRVTSKAGAHGVTQLMPATAKGLGVTDASDAAQNIWGGMKYLSQQFQTFGNWGLALAAYNAGPAAVSKARGVPPFPETQRYVRNIMSRAGFNFTGTYPVNFGLNDTNMKFIDKDTGALSRKGMNNLRYLLEQGAGYKGKVQCVYTNRPELLSNDPKYAEFASYRQMKGLDGKPLFRKGNNVDGFQVQVKTGEKAMNKLNPGAYAAIADSVSTHQTSFIPENDRDSIEALIHTFADRYDRSQQFDMNIKFNSNKFGLANLTADEYADYGVPYSVSSNPEMQARVLNQEFQRAKDVLGNERKAVFALAGGDIRDENGIIKSWEEVKQDKEAFRKNWYIQPSEDAAKRDEINTLVSNYNSYYNNIRGELA